MKTSPARTSAPRDPRSAGKEKHSLAANSRLAREWHPVKNGELTPADVLPYSNKKAWWRCRVKHEWEETVANRSSGYGCPYCSNHRVGEDNSLAAANPALSKEWHVTKNGRLTPKDVTSGSDKKVWWRCAHGHEWENAVYVRKRSGCPYCANRRAASDNCLATLRPDIAAEWHPTRNGSLTPVDVTPGSHKKAWWRCPKGHEWETEVRKRCYGEGCPYCAGRRVCEDNCLATVNPRLAAEWHPARNGNLTPHDVMPGSNKKVWWKCADYGHEWQVRINDRKRGTGCPHCYKMLKSLGFRPERSTSGVRVRTRKRRRTTTRVQHAPASARPPAKANAPSRGKAGSRAKNRSPLRVRRVNKAKCLATVNPKLAKEWHPTKNEPLTPRDVTYGSGQKVWWKCADYGHEWEAVVHQRSSGTGCPHCYRMLLDAGFRYERSTPGVRVRERKRTLPR